MKKALIAVAAALALPVLPTIAHADVAFNAGVVTDYRYRGISQTRLKPTLQAGVDFSQGSVYLGAWASGIQWIKDGGGDASIEIDLYGGVKGELSPGLGYDVGLLTYQYPSNKLNPSANTTEVYGALSYGLFTAKYSHSATHLFGFTDSKSSGYLDLSASIDLGSGWSLAPHVGHQRVRANSAFSYTDYALTVSKDFSGVVFSAAVVGTDTDAYIGAKGKDLGKAGIVLGAKVNF